MANESNLRPPFTPSEAREYGRQGGLKSGENKRERRRIRDAVEEVLNQEITGTDAKKALQVAGLDNPTYMDYVVFNVLQNTVKGGTVSDLAKLAALLGEESTDPDALQEARILLAAVPSVIDDN